MSKHSSMIVAFVAGVAVSIGGLVWLLTRDNRSAAPGGNSNLAAAANGDVKVSERITEYGPRRPYGEGRHAVRAYRRQDTGGQLLYGVQFIHHGIPQSSIIPADEAAALGRFVERMKDKTKRDAKEIDEATMSWSCRYFDGAERFSVTVDLAKGQWWMPFLESATPEYFQAIAKAVQDVEAMKKVAVSVAP